MTTINFPVSFTMEKFGFSPDMDNGDTNEDVWDGTGAYGGFLASATASKISSSSASDTSDGTGARTVRVFGLDANYAEFSNDLTMNGQTGVSLTTTSLRVYRAYVLTAGSGGVNAGDIWVGSGDITTGVPANKYAGILTGHGQTLMAVYTVPQTMLGGQTVKRALIHRWYAGMGSVQSAFGLVGLQVKEFGGAWKTKRLAVVSEGAHLDEDLSWGILVPPKTDVRVRVFTCGVANTQISAGFDLAIEA